MNRKRNYIPVIIMGLMCLGSIKVSSLRGLLSIFAIVYFLGENILTRRSYDSMGFKWKSIANDIKQYWTLIFLFVPINIIAIIIANVFVPGLFQHVFGRVEGMISFNNIIILIPQIVILALREEIVFRAFFQEKLCKIIKSNWAIIITSILFAIVHLSSGNISVVIYDLILVFIDSILFGVIYYKTKNVLTTTLSHALANFLGIIILFIYSMI